MGECLLDQSVSVLDLVMLKWQRLHDELRDRLLAIGGVKTCWDFPDWSSSSGNLLLLRFKQIESDRVLLASAVIVAASKNLRCTQSLSRILSSHTKIALDHLELFADLICRVCL